MSALDTYAKRLFPLLLASTSLLMWGVPASAQSSNWISSATTDAWARFGSGAWKTVRIVHKSFDESGALAKQGAMVTQTEVARVTRRSFSLQVTTTTELLGQWLPSDPQLIERNFGDPSPLTTSVGEDAVTIKGRDFPTQVVQTVTDEADLQRTSTVHLCKLTNPQVLKRVTVAKDPRNDQVKSHTTVTVTELDKTVDVLGELKSCWTVTTVIKVGEKTVTTTETHCSDVPGELVSRTTEEHNASGQLIRRSELELVGYGFGESRRRFRRRR